MDSALKNYTVRITGHTGYYTNWWDVQLLNPGGTIVSRGVVYSRWRAKGLARKLQRDYKKGLAWND